jgi:hypothetical protein
MMESRKGRCAKTEEGSRISPSPDKIGLKLAAKY